VLSNLQDQERFSILSKNREGMKHEDWMKAAIALSVEGVRHGEGGPFGAIVVKDGKIVGRGNNQVTTTNDPTAHAEVVAIRDACKNLGTFQLDDCVIYTSCEPCPMCLGAIYWARPSQVFYACTKADAAASGFDDQFIYDEIDKDLGNRRIPFVQIGRAAAQEAFRIWDAKADKVEY
jgi:guanine deaminase